MSHARKQQPERLQWVKASIKWPRDVYLRLCRIARAQGQTFAGFVRARVAPALREEEKDAS